MARPRSSNDRWASAIEGAVAIVVSSVWTGAGCLEPGHSGRGFRRMSRRMVLGPTLISFASLPQSRSTQPATWTILPHIGPEMASTGIIREVKSKCSLCRLFKLPVGYGRAKPGQVTGDPGDAERLREPGKCGRNRF